MSLVSLHDALNYTALSDLTVSPGGSRILYRTHHPDLESNGYIHQLWMKVGDGQPAPLKPDMSGRPLWLDEDTVLHAAPAPHGETIFCRTSLADGSQTELWRAPFPAAPIAQVDEDTILIRAHVDLRAKALFAGKTGAALEKARRELALEREDCMIMDEFPYWANGAGLLNKTRGCLFLCRRSGELTQLTGDDFTVGGAVYCPKCRTVFFSGAAFTVLRPFFLGVWSLNLDTMERRELMAEGEYLVEGLTLTGLGLAVMASFQGGTIAKTADIYLVDPDSGDARILCAQELSMGNSVCSDCTYPGGQAFAAWEDKLYFTATVDEVSKLLCCDMDGNVTTVVESRGSVDCFDLCPQGIYFVGLQDMRQHELYFQPSQGDFRRVTDYNDGFCREKQLSQPKPLSFINSEGNEIRGFVLEPMIPSDEKTCPAILDIHGGPLAAYGPVYYHEMQYWAAQGYYVLFCNPTGSTGRGQAFCDICGHNGETDYEDILAFTDRVLEAYPQIDPKRVGVTGGSYGGFMTNWIVGHTGRFAAACSQRSTSNNISNEAAADAAPLFLKSNLCPGETRTDERYWEQSPLKYVDAAITPTLFLHSLEDYVCYHAEALQMYAAFQRLGVPTRMVLFKGEHHGLSRVGRPRNRLRRLREITGWMDRYLRPGHEVDAE